MMRAKHWLFGLAVTVAGSMVAMGGCGGESSTATPSSDASADQTADRGSDAVVDAAPDVAACVSDADLNNLNLPDASINDAGASTSSCVACLKQHCQSEVNACNAICECRAVVVDFLDCVAKGGAIVTCFLQSSGNLPQEVAGVGQALGVCLYTSCQKACGAPSFDAGLPDAKPADGAAADSSSDATTD